MATGVRERVGIWGARIGKRAEHGNGLGESEENTGFVGLLVPSGIAGDVLGLLLLLLLALTIEHLLEELELGSCEGEDGE